MEIIVNTTADLSQAAQTLLNSFSKDRIFLLYGSMGAGKTTFVKHLCKQLNVQDSTSSPTFSIVNEYESPVGPIYHFDFYRIKDEQEAFDFGYEEYFYSGAYCFVEWPEKIPNLLPEEAKEIHISIIDATTRKISIR
ncbi:tRNA (adenosine(37)-N6)-threonylcarbamoyltransferase complex ATPase subunit type 1 TsaE [Sphingobacterium paramultivorum]|uniref:tRNA threonylcarbamoyladenosine biosynthesis protein TsaE n=1 Tax=Sphingobacterium paramultivorum TaxID=2886510 RepID=A0A7G5E6I4_9SPHI|nr:tRNA (adenosine(37)-N6)-threonylcarbamoyltransferase complex ATPase subunit type 1 TsaE [Sphingobacterium paramultivorum]QMV69609.1 tRNA (adenosine(37)-N6)-threonylcarbamoyltransferase complex ATPase subunit type 1 TsaE [Sphingobacterium paramultivorum]WSO13418.1 tRNA (adenosine(37)-N6)-threonylcarbamoyltransferase complex ATPase subunit type 1 TsaE [Sphingobacterium paramultivorum]